MDAVMQHLLSGPVEALMMYLELQKLNIENSIKIAIVCQQVENETQLENQQQKKRRQQGVRRRPRSCWARPWILRREPFGHWEALVQDLLRYDKLSFRNYHRLDEELFGEVLARISHRIEKKLTFWRRPLPPGLRLSATLRFLATGESFKSLAYNYRIGWNTMRQLVYETCEAIIDEFLEEYMPCPTTPEGWKEVADGFLSRWNFPHVIGAIDGKHIAIRCPSKGGSYYFNYKKFHSIVLLGLVDAQCRFIYVDVGSNGSCSDAGIFLQTDLRASLLNGTLGLPQPEPLPGGDAPVPYFFVGDDAFPLSSWMMKPYPHRGLTHEKRIFNYRVSRARRVVENAFGILANRLVLILFIHAHITLLIYDLL